MKYCPRCKTEKILEQFQLKKRNGKLVRSCYCIECNRQVQNEFYHKHRERYAKNHKIYEANNRERLNAYKRKLFKNPQYHIKASFYSSARKTLKGIMAGHIWVKTTGLETVKQFRDHLISTIPEGYTIDDYGSKLSMDHIIPCSAFDLTDNVQRQKCFHYTNLRLIPKEENYRKGKRILDNLPVN
jgi:hypothetical protein